MIKEEEEKSQTKVKLRGQISCLPPVVQEDDVPVAAFAMPVAVGAGEEDGGGHLQGLSVGGGGGPAEGPGKVAAVVEQVEVGVLADGDVEEPFPHGHAGGGDGPAGPQDLHGPTDDRPLHAAAAHSLPSPLHCEPTHQKSSRRGLR